LTLKQFILFLGFTLSLFYAHCQVSIFTQNGLYGLTENDKIIAQPVFNEIGWSNADAVELNDFVGYREGSKWGLLRTSNGKKTTSARYDKLIPFQYNKFIIANKGKFSNRFFYGVINENGKVLVSPDYFEMKVYGNVILSTLYQNSVFKVGAFDKNLNKFMKDTYKSIQQDAKLLMAKKFNGLTDIYSVNGKKIVEDVERSFDIAAGKVIIIQGNQGLIDENGRIIHDIIYKKINRSGTPVPFEKWVIRSKKKDRIFMADSLGISNLKSVLIFKNGLFHFENNETIRYKLIQLENKGMVAQSLNDTWFGFNGFGKVAVESIDSIKFEKGYFLLKTNNKWQVHKSDGARVIQETFDQIRVENDHFISVKRFGYWALLDGLRGTMTDFKYDEIKQVVGQKAAVKYVGDYGVIFNNQWLINPDYDDIFMNDKYIICQKNRAYFLYNHSGTLLLKTIDEIILEDEVLKLKYRDRYSILNQRGKPVDNTEFDFAKKVNDFYMLKRGDSVKMYDENGKQIVKLSDDIQEIESFADGLFVIKKNDRYGFINSDGQLRISNRYESARTFNEGLAAIKLRGKWGFINKQEKIIVQPFYDRVSDFHKSLSVIQSKELFGIINQSGMEILKPEYEMISKISNDYFITTNTKQKYGLVNAEGKIVFNSKYDMIVEVDSYLKVKLGEKWGLLNLQGDKIEDLQYNQILIQNGEILLQE